MRKFEIILPTGASRLFVVEGRPQYLDGADMIIGISDTVDIEVVTSHTTLDALVTLSIFFGKYRGLPRDSIVASVNGREYTLPKVDKPYGIFRLMMPKYKLLHPTAITLAGMNETVYTVIGERTLRVVFFGERYPVDMLRRLRVIDGAPNADAVISVAPRGEKRGLISTDSHIFYSDIASLNAVLTAVDRPPSLRLDTPHSTVGIEFTDHGDSYILMDLDEVKISALE